MKERLLARISPFVAALFPLLAIALSLYLLQMSAPTWAALHRSQTVEAWAPRLGQFGMVAIATRTLASTAIAVVCAVPLALCLAVYTSEYASAHVRRWCSGAIDLFANVPSVVVGGWAATTLAPKIAGPESATLWSGLLLAVMVLPLVCGVARDVLVAVPAELRDAGTALGGTRSEVLVHVVLPHARAGLLAAIMLGIGLAITDSVAVAMLCAAGDLPSTTIASALAREFRFPTSAEHEGALYDLALVLVVISVGFNWGSHQVVRRYAKRGATGLSTGPSHGELGDTP